MLPAAFHRLTAVAAGFRGSNQLMLAGTPLVVAALFGGGPAGAGRIGHPGRDLWRALRWRAARRHRGGPPRLWRGHGADRRPVCSFPAGGSAVLARPPSDAAAAHLLLPLTHENPAWEARGFRHWAAARWGALLRAAVTGRHGKRQVSGQKGLALAGEQGAALACHPPALRERRQRTSRDRVGEVRMAGGYPSPAGHSAAVAHR